MILTIHRRECSIVRGDGWTAAYWLEYGFEPLAIEERLGAIPGYRHEYLPMPSIEVAVPGGCRITPRGVVAGNVLRLATYFNPFGLDAESVYRLAAHAEGGFSMAKKRPDGPSLFGETPVAGPGPYPRPARPEPDRLPWEPPPGLPPEPVRLVEGDTRARLEQLAAQVVAEHRSMLGDRAQRLEDAIREALPWLDEAGGRKPMPLTAANILTAALDWTPETAQAKSA